ncbi:MAG: hypothetical protein Q8L23_18080 [Caulobacter sp.]|nr:hypothetical protein [Caulobacter sp.]
MIPLRVMLIPALALSLLACKPPPDRVAELPGGERLRSAIQRAGLATELAHANELLAESLGKDPPDDFLRARAYRFVTAGVTNRDLDALRREARENAAAYFAGIEGRFARAAWPVDQTPAWYDLRARNALADVRIQFDIALASGGDVIGPVRMAQRIDGWTRGQASSGPLLGSGPVELAMAAAIQQAVKDRPLAQPTRPTGQPGRDQPVNAGYGALAPQ